MPEIAEPPLDIPVGYPAPANVGRKTLPPLAQVVSSPLQCLLSLLPLKNHHSLFQLVPYVFSLPPCSPIGNGSPYYHPPTIPVQKLWCVAKPSVPEEELQQALDYACGEGGADCLEIMPQGTVTILTLWLLMLLMPSTVTGRSTREMVEHATLGNCYVDKF
ncbi:X8 domain [Sesbania bispinosa]|nr:X8 domain [Sesbania bispinosa]